MLTALTLKLKNLAQSKIKNEAEVVYFLAGVRKIIERTKTHEEFQYLNFHCNWILHSKLSGNFAQKILAYFEEAHHGLLNEEELPEFCSAFKISKMNYFRSELSNFLALYNIGDFTKTPEDWNSFIFLYAQIVQDCPLILKIEKKKKPIETNEVESLGFADLKSELKEVVITVDLGGEIDVGERIFRINWSLSDLSGNSGTISIFNSIKFNFPTN